MSDRGLPYVDPHKRRGIIYRAFAWLVATPAVAWLSRKVGWKLDPHLLRLTRGRIGTGMLLPTALLETRGARTARPRRNAVIYFHDGERVTIFASNQGFPQHPNWFHNLRAHPDVTFGGRPFHAEVVEQESEQERIWQLADRVFPPYAGYRQRAASSGRAIPIVQLTPR